MPPDPVHLYRAPNRLSVEEIEPRRILIVGSCLAEALPTTAVAVQEDQLEGRDEGALVCVQVLF